MRDDVFFFPHGAISRPIESPKSVEGWHSVTVFYVYLLVASTFLVKEGYNSNQLDGALVMGRQHILSETSLWIGLWIIMIKFKRCQLLIRDPAAKCSAKKSRPFMVAWAKTWWIFLTSFFFSMHWFPKVQVYSGFPKPQFHYVLHIISNVKQPVGCFLIQSQIIFLGED